MICFKSKPTKSNGGDLNVSSGDLGASRQNLAKFASGERSRPIESVGLNFSRETNPWIRFLKMEIDCQPLLAKDWAVFYLGWTVWAGGLGCGSRWTALFYSLSPRFNLLVIFIFYEI